VILTGACRTIDLLDNLQMIIDRDRPLQRWGEDSRSHPAMPESRQHRIALARLLAALGIPADDDDRQAVRGVLGASIGRDVGEAAPT
jgi:hypothetical protein